MDRRSFVGVLGASLPLLAARPAFAQERPSIDISPDELLRIVANPQLFSLMLAEMDACWIVLVEGNPTATAEFIANARTAYLQYRTQLNRPENMDRVIDTLKHSDWRASAERLAAELQPVLIRVREQIIRNGISESSRLVNVFVRAFNGFSQSLRALSADNDAWYCHCYGLELLCK